MELADLATGLPWAQRRVGLIPGEFTFIFTHVGVWALPALGAKVSALDAHATLPKHQAPTHAGAFRTRAAPC
jgi:hypothetical protein